MSILLQLYLQLKNWLDLTRLSQAFTVLGSLLLLIAVGTGSYMRLEGWSFLEAVYATVITITTIGYGDLTPVTVGGRVFAIGFSLVAIGLGGYAISSLAIFTVETRQRTLARLTRRRLMQRVDSLNNHYIVCGANLIGTRIATDFNVHGVDFVLIDTDEARLKHALLFSHPEYFRQKVQTVVDFHEVDLTEYESLPLSALSERVNTTYLQADPTDDTTLVQAGIDRAQAIVTVLEDDRDNLSVVIGARSLANRTGNTTLRVMANVAESRNLRKMYLAGADFVRLHGVVSGSQMAAHIRHPEIGNWWYSDLTGETSGNGIFHQQDLHAEHNWVNKTVADVHRLHGVIIVSVKRDGAFISPPAFDLTLRPDDIAIVIGQKAR